MGIVTANPASIHFRAPTKDDWEAHPSKASTFRLRESLWTDFPHFEDLRFLTREVFAAGALNDGRHASDVELERWELHVVVIWTYLLSRKGRFPPILPKGPLTSRWECADCRNAVLDKVATANAFDTDDDDEHDDADDAMSEDEIKRQKNIAATKANRKRLHAISKAMKMKNKQQSGQSYSLNPSESRSGY
jgi:hypothetical protein